MSRSAPFQSALWCHMWCHIALLQVLFMQSDGGLSDIASFSGHLAILSGPAGLSLHQLHRYVCRLICFIICSTAMSAV